MNAVLAACTTCPALAAADTEVRLIPLMDEHTDKTGHRLWALSLLNHSGRNR